MPVTTADRRGRYLGEDLAEVERAELIEDPDQPQPKGQVADAVDDERLLRGAGGGAAGEPEPDQQVRRQTDPLPEEEEEEEVVGQDQHQHREDEEGKIGEEAGKTRVALHVPLGIDVDQKSDAGDHDQHHRGQLIDEEIDADVEGAGLDPGVEILPQWLARGADLAEYQQREEERGEDRRGGDPVRSGAQVPPEEEVDDEGQKRQQRDEVEVLFHCHQRDYSWRRGASGRTSHSAVPPPQYAAADRPAKSPRKCNLRRGDG